MDKIINESIDRLKAKPKNDFTANCNYDDDDNDSISVLDKTDYDYNDINSKIYGQNYRFDNDDEILNSFQKYLKNMTWNITQDKIPDITELDTF